MLYKFFKGLTLLVPLILCVVLFITIIHDVSSSSNDTLIIHVTENSIDAQLNAYKEELKAEYANSIDNLESRVDILMAIVGIAVSVWVSLNIFSVIERHQLDATEEKLRETLKKLNEAEKKLDAAMERMSAFEMKVAELEDAHTIVKF